MYGTGGGDATPNLDYTPVSGTLTFGSGQASQTFTVPIADDQEAEGLEALNLGLSDPGGGATLGARTSATVTITDDEAAVEFGASAYAVTEGGVASLVVRRTGPLAGPATVEYHTVDGSARAGTDYVATSGTVSFAAKAAQATIRVATLNDAANEPAETLTVVLGPASAGLALGHRSVATVTIADNDPGGAIQLGASSYAVTEGGTASVLVTRSGGTVGGVTVNYTLTDVTTEPGDHTASGSGTLTFGAGQVSRTVTIPTVDDGEVEGTETLAITLSTPTGGATLGPQQDATLTINDNDGSAFQFAASAAKVSEAAGKTTITVRRTGTLAESASVGYWASGGSAEAGSDFALTPATLVFGPNVAVKTFTVMVLEDGLDETDETVELTLHDPSANSSLGAPSRMVLTIADNDVAGTVQFGSAVFSKVEGEEGTSTFVTIPVTRTGGTAGGVTVEFATFDDTATGDVDYVPKTGTLAFGAGETSKTFAVEILGDGAVEGNESVSLRLANPTQGARLGSPSVATLWIVEPAGAAKLVFVHEGTGAAWLSDRLGQLGLVLRDNNYFVSDTGPGWGPEEIGSRTDIGHWWTWFQGPSSASYVAALLGEYGQSAPYARLADPDPLRGNEVVVLLSGFANSALAGDPAEPPVTGEDNPLRDRDASSSAMTVANAKGIYLDLLAYFAAHTDRLFVIATAPPLVAGQTDATRAANARAFNDWLARPTGWRRDYPHRNLAVLDLYNVLTSNGGTAAVSDVGRETGNHHRFWNGVIQHVHPVASNVSAYPTSATDSTPTVAGLRKATTELAVLINYAYNRWKGTAPQAPVVTGLRAAAPSRRLGLEAIAPPGRIAPPHAATPPPP
jgi:hypothetical protein